MNHACYPSTLFITCFSEFYEHACCCEPYLYLIPSLGVQMSVQFALIKMHVVCYIFMLTLMSFL